MNRRQKITEIKKLLREFEDSERALKQSLATITSCKYSLNAELEGLGASNSAPKRESILTEKQKNELLGGLTA
ncbi:hypothetical protein OX284_010085 [Flavobacterium sp. SUN046]|uniref:hypothetical protein n=1 Tax=Flavobacterium sp. SUN046 TaxID=3002440 RepID=UPI002DB91C7A|nr:hypothetical protein [Flavobacterium sp. SUN046]MEC4049776.1 hypothetical protein [Flavobacterium sp. SUN046]